MALENTLDYSGYVASLIGLPEAGKAVTIKREDTGTAVVTGLVTDAAGRWKADDLDPQYLYTAEIASGNTPQVAIKKCWSGDVWSLLVREKLVARPTAIINFPTPANVYLGGTPILTNLDGRFYNVGEQVADAHTVDGQHAAAFAIAGHDHNAAYSLLGHAHAYSPDTHNHNASYSLLGHTHPYSAADHDHAGVYGRVESAEWTGDGAAGRVVYTIPAGFSPRCAIIHEVSGGAGTFAIVSRNQNGALQGTTNAFANSGPGNDEIAQNNSACYFDNLNGGALTVGGVNPGVGMNFGGSLYVATIFLKDV